MDAILRFRHLHLAGFGLIIARLALEALDGSPARPGYEAPHTDLSWWVGIWWGVPILLLFEGIRRRRAPLTWPKLLTSLALLGVVLFGLGGFVSYTVGQLQGWNFGRFTHDREWSEAREQAKALAGAESTPPSEADIARFLPPDRPLRKDASRVPFVPGQSLGPILKNSGMVFLVAGFFGTLWTLALGSLFIGFPAMLARREDAG